MARLDLVYLIFKTDANHTHQSKVLIGVSTDKFTAYGICAFKAKEEGEEFYEENIEHLRDMNQTQNYEGVGEFVLVESALNTLL